MEVARAAVWCHPVHVIRGRLRLRLDRPDVFHSLAERFEAWLRDQPGVQGVRLNPGCRSLILHYDADGVAPETLVATIERLALDQLSAYQPSRQAQDPPAQAASWWPLGLSTAAMALGLLAESALAPWLLASAAIPIFDRAYAALTRKGRLNVDVLDAAATTVLLLQGQVPTAAMMVWLVALGDVIRDITMQQSQRAIEALFHGTIDSAWVLRQGEKVRVPVTAIRDDEQVVVYPGELIPVDGLVLSGQATVDQKVLTGESMPVVKAEGDQAYAATVVREGKLYLQAARVGADTTASKVVQLIRSAPVRETRAQNYAEQFADRLVPWSFAAAGGALLMGGGLNRAAAFLIIDYGTGVRVAAPTTVLSSMAQAARQGIFIKGGRYLEQLAAVDAIVFDKTGTLTWGTPEIVDIIAYRDGERSTAQLLALAASAQQRLTHPVAEAIVRTAQARGLRIPERDDSEYLIGLGVEAPVDGMRVLVGSRRLMGLKGVALGPAEADIQRLDAAAVAPIFVAIDGQLSGALVLSDPLRPEAKAVVQGLQAQGVREIVMLTGDHPAVAKKVAETLGLTRYIAEALPAQKAALVRELQGAGHTVAVIGDGINDSPALAQADVGIAVHGGTDVARETAHVVLLEENLWKIPQAIAMARESMALIRLNWQLICYPNTAALALSLAGVIGPIGATLISNGSAILATGNALRPLWNSPPTHALPRGDLGREGSGSTRFA